MNRHSRFIVITIGLLCLCHFAQASGLSLDKRKSSPLTTKGDLYTYSTTNTKLGVGANGKVLSADSSTATGLVWADPPSSSGGAGTVTNAGALTSNAIVIGQGGNAVATITADTSTAHALMSTATSPAFRTITSNDVVGTHPVAVGGTGLTSGTANGVVIFANTGLMASTTADTVTTHAFMSTATAPAFRAITTADVVGTHAVLYGGTGITSGTSGGVPYFANTGLMASSNLLTSNAVMLGGGAGAAPNTITADTNASHFLGSTTTGPAFRQVRASDIRGAGDTYSAIQFNDATYISSDTALIWEKGSNTLSISRDVSQSGEAIHISSDTGALLANVSHDGTAFFQKIEVAKQIRVGRGVSANISADIGGSFRTVPISLDSAASNVVISADQGNFFTLLLNAQPRTLYNPDGGAIGQKIIVMISQDATGSRKIGIGPTTNSLFSFGSTISTFDASTAAGMHDYIGLIKNTVSWDVVAVDYGHR